jgi:hypothetical protein
MPAASQPRTARIWLWQTAAWALSILILVTAWQPPIIRRWSRADILLLILLLACDWLVLKRIDHLVGVTRRSPQRPGFKVIWSLLLILALILLAVSKSRS